MNLQCLLLNLHNLPSLFGLVFYRNSTAVLKGARVIPFVSVHFVDFGDKKILPFLGPHRGVAVWMQFKRFLGCLLLEEVPRRFIMPFWPIIRCRFLIIFPFLWSKK